LVKTKLSPSDRADYAKAKKLIAYFSQNMYVLENERRKGEFVTE